MELNKLTLKDQDLFKHYLTYLPTDLAVFSFANIYIWKALFKIRWVIIQESLCIFFQDAIGCFMYLPPLAAKPQAEVLPKVFKIMDEINKNKDISRVENIPQGAQDYYRNLGYRVLAKDADYLCARQELVELKGNKFKSQRAAYNYFIKHYNFSVRDLRKVDFKDCLNLFNSWAKARMANSSDDLYRGMIEDNRKVIKETFANYEKLNLEGIIVRDKNKIKGFTLGYRVNRDTFCIFYEITDLTVKGLAQFIFRTFAIYLKDFKYINIMDDSGLESLRKVKNSYKPRRMVEAYCAYAKDA